MSSSLFAKTARLEQAVELINNLPEAKFPLLLSRILHKFHLKDEESFTEEEQEKLQGSLSLNAQELRRLLQTLSFIFEQAAYHLCKAPILNQNLEAIGVCQEKREAIVEAWSGQAKRVTEALRGRSLGSWELKDLSWELRVKVGQSSLCGLRQPLGVLQLQLGSNAQEEQLALQFTQDQLFNLYSQLETVQSQLDALR